MKRKNKLSDLHINRLILFAEHLQQCKREDYYLEEYSKNCRPPHMATNIGIVFITFPFVYQELPNVFPSE